MKGTGYERKKKSRKSIRALKIFYTNCSLKLFLDIQICKWYVSPGKWLTVFVSFSFSFSIITWAQHHLHCHLNQYLLYPIVITYCCFLPQVLQLCLLCVAVQAQVRYEDKSNISGCYFLGLFLQMYLCNSWQQCLYHTSLLLAALLLWWWSFYISVVCKNITIRVASDKLVWNQHKVVWDTHKMSNKLRGN